MMTISGWGLTAPAVTQELDDMTLLFTRSTFVGGIAYAIGDVAEIDKATADKLIQAGKAVETDEAAKTSKKKAK